MQTLLRFGDLATLYKKNYVLCYLPVISQGNVPPRAFAKKTRIVFLVWDTTFWVITFSADTAKQDMYTIKTATGIDEQFGAFFKLSEDTLS